MEMGMSREKAEAFVARC